MAALAHTQGIALADRDALIRTHLGLARRIARKVARRVPRTVMVEELESAALLGLTEAASRYDAARGEPFVAFAAKRVRGAILDELRRNDVLTRRGREHARRLAEATRAVEARAGRPATSEELATELGVGIREVNKMRARLSTPALVPIDDAAEVPRARPAESPDSQVALAQQKRALARALKALPARDQQVLSMSYSDGLTLGEIGEILGVTESRVCQLRSRALKALRRAMADD